MTNKENDEVYQEYLQEQREEYNRDKNDEKYDNFKEDNSQFLMTEFVGFMIDEYEEYCRNEFSSWGDD